MKDVIKIFEQLKADSSKSGKERVIKDNLDNPLFVECIQFLLDPFVLTGISTKKISKSVNRNTNQSIICYTISDVMNYLKSNNTGRDEDILVCNDFIMHLRTEEEKEFTRGLITKSIKLGVDSLWNKTVPENMKIGEFNVMLAKKASEHMDKIKGKFALTKKLDGTRIILIKENGKVKTFTRTGQEYIGLNQIENEFITCHLDNMVWDGELLADVEGTTSEIFTETLKKSRTKDADKTGLKFHVFDMFPLEEFKQGKSKDKAIKRKTDLHSFFTLEDMTYACEVAPLYIGDDMEQITVWSNWAKENEFEGIMVNIDAPYECKRTSNLLKVKEMNTIDIYVVDFKIGEGRLSSTLGNLIVDYKGNLVGVGTGLSDEMRNEIWENKRKYVNRLAEIQYFEESMDSKTKKVSLRFPVFKQWRFDKNEESYN